MEADKPSPMPKTEASKQTTGINKSLSLYEALNKVPEMFTKPKASNQHPAFEAFSMKAQATSAAPQADLQDPDKHRSRVLCLGLIGFRALLFNDPFFLR